MDGQLKTGRPRNSGQRVDLQAICGRRLTGDGRMIFYSPNRGDTPTPQELARYLGGKKARRAGSGWLSLCPAHNDRTPSLSLGSGDDRVLVHCLAGCSQEAVLDALKERGVYLTRSPLVGRPKPQPRAPAKQPTAKDCPAETERQALALRIWSEAQAIYGTVGAIPDGASQTRCVAAGRPHSLPEVAPAQAGTDRLDDQT